MPPDHDSGAPARGLGGILGRRWVLSDGEGQGPRTAYLQDQQRRGWGAAGAPTRGRCFHPSGEDATGDSLPPPVEDLHLSRHQGAEIAGLRRAEEPIRLGAQCGTRMFS